MSSGIDRSFFRQGAWMVTATTAAGGFMFLSQVVAAMNLNEPDFALVGALLSGLNLMMIPAIGLQTVFAQQTASAASSDDRARLAATVQAVSKAVLAMSAFILLTGVLFQGPILALLQTDQRIPFLILIAISLPQLWLPIGLGVMQGRQAFLWVGAAQFINGAGRFIAIVLLLVVAGMHATGFMIAAMIGLGSACALALRHTPELLAKTEASCDWSGLLRRIVPLSIGLGSGVCLMSVDMIFVKANFEGDVPGLYAKAGLIGRGLVMFSAPLAQVMFPKIIVNARTSGRSAVFLQTVVSTAALAVAVSLGFTILCAILPGWLFNIAEGGSRWAGNVQSFLDNQGNQLALVCRLIPAFVWAMTPLTIANVMINHILALRRHHAVPWLAGVAVLYVIALCFLNNSLTQVLATLAVANAVLAGTAAFFSLRDRP